MNHPIKFTDNNKDTLLLDSLFAVDEYLEYATKHNMNIMFTETCSSSSVEYIYKFVEHGYKLQFEAVKQVAPDGLVLSPKIRVFLYKEEFDAERAC